MVTTCPKLAGAPSPISYDHWTNHCFCTGPKTSPLKSVEITVNLAVILTVLYVYYLLYYVTCEWPVSYNSYNMFYFTYFSNKCLWYVDNNYVQMQNCNSRYIANIMTDK